MKPIRIFRHQDWVEPGRLTQFLDARSVPWELVRIDEGDPVPRTADDAAGLAFLGGTMSVNDDLPWLSDEMALIRKAAAQDVPMLGHCLGSQLIAKALGGTVAPMPTKEIGWWRMSHADNPEARAWLDGVPDPVEILAWHHEAFTLPPGATLLYSNANCQTQAYARGNTVATVAHPEVTAELLETWLNDYGDDVESDLATVQPIDELRRNLAERCAAMHAAFTDPFYEKWLSRVKAYAQRREQATG
ncbi:MAG: type 1 glutamine amidotransferase [Pseudomonadota bacterium]